MEDARPIMPGDLPEWIQEAEKAVANGDIQMPEPTKEVTIKFGKGLVGEQFTSKSGHELVKVKIPNADKDDHTPWASFVISPKMVHDNKFGKGVWMKLPEDGTIRVSKPKLVGKTPEGKNKWENEFKEVSATELKDMIESYKTKERGSLLDNLKDKKKESARQLVKEHTSKALEAAI